MNNKLLSIIFIVLISFCLACEENELLKENPRDRLTAENLYVTPEGFENGLNALYAMVRRERETIGSDPRAMPVLWASSMDNTYNPVNNTTDLPYVQWGEFNNSFVNMYEDAWDGFYQTINAANTIIGRAETNSIDWNTSTEKDLVIAQAKLIRTWAYRHLINLWGDVPLVLKESTGTSIKNDWVRTPKAEIMEVMEEDLLFAEQHLPELHSIPGRLNKAVAQHFLAELYLMMGEPAKAEEKAKAEINNPNFSIITERYGVGKEQPGVPFMDQFYDGNVFHNQGNTEALWTFPYERDVIGGEGYGSLNRGNRMRRNWLPWYWRLPGVNITPEHGGRGIGFLGITLFGLNLYEPQDDRASEYAIHRYLITDNGDTIFTTTNPDEFNGVGPAGPDPFRPNNWPATRKWDDGDPDFIFDDQGYKDQPYIRLAETYLLLAEAQFLQNKISEAAETLNIIRRRSNASEISEADIDIDFILDERARELVAEEHRRYTLLRLNKWLERARVHNNMSGQYITERDKFYPIPQSVIDSNLDAVMPQNPGY